MRKSKYISMALAFCLAAALWAAGPAMAQQSEIPLGARMPQTDLVLPEAVDGRGSLAQLAGTTGTVVVFWSNQCPWVDKYEDRLLSLADEFRGQGISFVLVNANDAEAFPRESAAESRRRAEAQNFAGRGVNYLLDANSQLASAFGAERTPHVFMFDAASVLVYSGAIDDSPGDPANVQKHYLREALQTLADGGEIAGPETKAFGCTIKFRD